MHFLLEYKRSEGKLISYREFEDSQRAECENARLDLELDLNRRGVDHEVNILEAHSRQALLLTHRRYFFGLDHFPNCASLETTQCLECNGIGSFPAFLSEYEICHVCNGIGLIGSVKECDCGGINVHTPPAPRTAPGK